MQRDGGDVVDRFRNRLMIPICRDAGSVIAFGGRAMDAGPAAEVPELARDADLLEEPHALRAESHEGRDPAGELRGARRGLLRLRAAAAGRASAPVVASCGTALTPQQAQLLRRFTGKVVLSFDPDAAGQGAAVRSCEMLVARAST